MDSSWKRRHRLEIGYFITNESLDRDANPPPAGLPGGRYRVELIGNTKPVGLSPGLGIPAGRGDRTEFGKEFMPARNAIWTRTRNRETRPAMRARSKWREQSIPPDSRRSRGSMQAEGSRRRLIEESASVHGLDFALDEQPSRLSGNV
jgi:hypothetical protein